MSECERMIEDDDNVHEDLFNNRREPSRQDSSRLFMNNKIC